MEPRGHQNAIDSCRHAVRVKDLGDTSFQAIADTKKGKWKFSPRENGGREKDQNRNLETPTFQRLGRKTSQESGKVRNGPERTPGSQVQRVSGK